MGSPVAPTALSVAVVDDDDSVRLLLCRLVEREDGMELAGDATDGRQAIDLAADAQPDVVILDLMMPVMDGLEAMPRIREVSPRTRILFFTAVGERCDEIIGAGADDCLAKGEDWDTIARRLRRLAPAD